MSVNYTEEQVSLMIEQYENEPTRETVENLAGKLNKSIKSIIGKLSREGVYQKAIYRTKTGEVPMTKGEIILNISELLECEYDKLAGLEKSPKQNLKYLLDVCRSRT